ncbi:hypothetical protein BDW22DRAFT_1354977 [Trametopsis cervina]|nr:hypothetical protein BDW22DRAFT_1354977 [Trametopsis cervina]
MTNADIPPPFTLISLRTPSGDLSALPDLKLHWRNRFSASKCLRKSSAPRDQGMDDGSVSELRHPLGDQIRMDQRSTDIAATFVRAESHSRGDIQTTTGRSCTPPATSFCENRPSEGTWQTVVGYSSPAVSFRVVRALNSANWFTTGPGHLRTLNIRVPQWQTTL